MRFLLAGYLLSIAVASTLSAQVTSSEVLEKGPFYRVVRDTLILKDSEGRETTQSSTYSELGDGLNYWDNEAREWKPTNPEFKMFPQGAVARELATQVIIAPDIRAEAGAVDMLTWDGKRFRSNPAFLAFRDMATGRGAVIAKVKSSQATLFEKNVIVFDDALDSFRAVFRYTVGPNSAEQDLILLENSELLDPQSFGLNRESSRLELWTEFLEFGAEDRIIDEDRDGTKDITIDFGSAIMGAGKAFSLGDDDTEIPVTKDWGKVEGTQFLVESVSYKHLEPLLDRLPQQAKHGGPDERLKRMARVVDSPKDLVVAHRAHKASLDPKSLAAEFSKKPVKLENGLVIDYTLISVHKTNFVFASSETYLILTNVSFYAETRFEGGSCIKFVPTNSARITLNSNAVFTSSAFRPVVFTARDDHACGERIGTADLNGHYAYAGLYVNTAGATAGITANNLIFKHALTGIYLVGRQDHVFSHIQMVNCGSGIKGSSTTYHLRNALMDNVRTNFTGGSSTGRVEHLTSDNADYVNYSGSNLHLSLTNSLLANIGTLGTLANTQNVAVLPTSAGLFKSVVAGKYYLASTAYRDVGTPNVSIGSELKQMTTQAPLLWASHFMSETILAPTVQRDTNGFDYGWHYFPLDYCLSNQNLSATLILTNGVSIGVYGDSGIMLQSGAKLISEGRPETLNRLVKFNTVQAGTNVFGTNSGTYYGLLEMTNTPAVRADIHLRFTELAFLGENSLRTRFLHTGGGYTRATPNQMRFRDSQFLNIDLGVYPDTAGLPLTFTNCLFERCNVNVSDGSFGSKALSLKIQDCTFVKGDLGLTHSTNSYIWSVTDSVFDTVSLTTGGSVALANGWNGYRSTAGIPGTSGGDVTLTTLDWEKGPLGSYYYPTNVNGQNLATLVNKGTVLAANLGMYHYTTAVSGAKEAATTNDIGFHYIATGANGLTADTDLDGAPDYIEDNDGNGVKASTETDIALIDTDYDGCTDGLELVYGLDPLNPNSFIHTKLGEWTFDDPVSPYNGSLGQIPFEATSLSITSLVADFECAISHAYYTLNADGSDSQVSFLNTNAVLRYREDDNGLPNINCRRGSVEMVFRPNWSSTNCSGIGPMQTVALWSIGDMGLRISPQGTNIYFVSVNASGTLVTNVSVPLQLCTSNPLESNPVCYPPPGGFPYPVRVVVEWDEFYSAIILDSDSAITPPTIVMGSAVTGIPSALQRASGLRFANSYDGSMPFRGTIDRVSIENIPRTCIEFPSPTYPADVRVKFTNSPPQISISWRGPTNCWVQLLRRPHAAGVWKPLTLYKGTNFVDSNIKIGVTYDYSIQFFVPSEGQYDYPGSESYQVVAGVDLPPVLDRGKCILLVDKTLTNNATLGNWLGVLQTNLVADGWSVVRFNVDRHDDVTWSNNPPNIKAIKQVVVQEYDQDPERTKAVFIIGHVAIPYSGSGEYDGHNGNDGLYDHRGAWVADSFYGDVQSQLWTDTDASVTITGSGPKVGQQAPGDGKFDPDLLPSPLEMMVGRVDFANMPAFQSAPQNVSEVNLLIRYLAKDATYRVGTNPVSSSTIWGYYDYGAGFGPGATILSEQLIPTFGPSIANSYFGDMLRTNSRIRIGILAGSGNPGSIWGSRANPNENYQTTEIAALSLAPRADFAFFLGSYFSDWNFTTNNWCLANLTDSNNTVAVLGASPVPPKFQSLAGNKPIGYATYWTSGALRLPIGVAFEYAHVTCLGDPTLRIIWPASPTGFTATRSGSNVLLSWSTIPTGMLGAVVEVSAPSDNGSWRLLTWPPATGTSLSYSSPGGANEQFRLRLAHNITAGTTSLTNLSQGILKIVP